MLTLLLAVDPVTWEGVVQPANSAWNDYFGAEVAGVGDVDGDGHRDLAVGAVSLNHPAEAVHLFYGSPDGILEDSEQQLFVDVDFGSRFGSTLAGGADVDGDGLDDLVAGLPRMDGSRWRTGGVALYTEGGSSVQILQPATPVSRHELGLDVAMPGDLDGDGYADIASTALGGERVTVFYGTSGPFGDADDHVVPLPDGAYRFTVAGAGDTNGDGFADLVAASWSPYDEPDGAAWLWLGAASGLEQAPDTVLDGEDGFGAGVAGVGDLNGDGLDDLSVTTGASYYSGIPAAVTLFYGSVSGPMPSQVLSDPAPYDAFADTVAGVGDLDRDGFDEVLVTASYAGYSGSSARPGALYLYFGSATGVGRELKLARDEHIELGTGAAGLGDVDNDGFPDFAAGAGDLQPGSVYLFDGACRDPQTVFADLDGDGFGSGPAILSCGPETGGAQNADDCDDGDGSIYPGAPERPDDCVDANCDGAAEDCEGKTANEARVSCATGPVTAFWLALLAACAIRRGRAGA